MSDKREGRIIHVLGNNNMTGDGYERYRDFHCFGQKNADVACSKCKLRFACFTDRDNIELSHKDFNKKSRNGFISNSSTTSFIVLVKPEKVSSVEFILRHLKHWQDGKTCPTVPERVKFLNKELKELDKDLVYVDKLVTRVTGMSDQTLKDHQFLLKYSMHTLRQDAIRNDRLYAPKREAAYKRDHLCDYARLKDDLEKAKTNCNNELKSLEGNDDWVFVTFEEDANWGTLKQMVADLEKSGNAIILKQETS